MADHFVDIVDENDQVIGKEMKSKKLELGFISRVAAVLVRDSNGKFIICKRSPNKKYSPNLFDLSACGNVDAGEDYKTAAKRELKEELGIDCDVKLLNNFYQEVDHEDQKLKFFCSIFVAESDQNPNLNDELASYNRMTVEEIIQGIEKNPENFCQGFRNDFAKVKNMLTN